MADPKMYRFPTVCILKYLCTRTYWNLLFCN